MTTPVDLARCPRCHVAIHGSIHSCDPLDMPQTLPMPEYKFQKDMMNPNISADGQTCYGPSPQPTSTADDIAAAEKRGVRKGMELAAKIADDNYYEKIRERDLHKNDSDARIWMDASTLAVAYGQLAAAIRAAMEG